jgi:site-specific DNA-methyltransferase (adenine-specific)
MITTGLMTSLTDQWATPQNLFDDLDAKHNFTLDVCASSWNHKCERYFDIETDGLLQDWKQEVCWMNPPYGRSIGLWMRKAFEASQLGATVVCLVPARTDTAWWHDYAMTADEIRFIKGRLKFDDQKNPAPFPSAILVFRGLNQEEPNE